MTSGMCLTFICTAKHCWNYQIILTIIEPTDHGILDEHDMYLRMHLHHKITLKQGEDYKGEK